MNKKAALANDLVEYSQAGKKLCRETQLQTYSGDETLPGKPQPRGDTQINGDGLVEDIRASQEYV